MLVDPLSGIVIDTINEPYNKHVLTGTRASAFNGKSPITPPIRVPHRPSRPVPLLKQALRFMLISVTIFSVKIIRYQTLQYLVFISISIGVHE
jgi:hypothetical protein